MSAFIRNVGDERTIPYFSFTDVAHGNNFMRLDILTYDQRIVVGFDYQSRLMPMRQDVQMQTGTAQGRRFQLNRMTVQVLKTFEFKCAVMPATEGTPWDYTDVQTPQSATGTMWEDYEAVAYDGNVDVLMHSRTVDAVNPIIMINFPLPLIIAGLVLKFEVTSD